MQHDRPDAVDTRLALRLYAALVGGYGVLVYLWPRRMLPGEWGAWLTGQPDLFDIPWGTYALVRIAASVLAALGMCALVLAGIDDPRDRRRALFQFGVVHLVAGGMFWLQWSQVLAQVVSPNPGFSPIAIGLILLFIAIADARQPFRNLITLFDSVEPGTAPTDRLRSEYEEQIARAARQEERARLARDLHDAVKQQLFVIHTAAATAQERFDSDATGAKTALNRIRTSAREATVEMAAMIDQYQSPPLASVGLIDALRQQCDALRFRTGADVTLQADALPPDWAMPPGTPETLFRIAQEALANVARHARASSVRVTLAAAAGHVRLTVHDDGSGFDSNTAIRGVGTTSMRERTEYLGGTFELWTRPGGGTTIRTAVPYDSTTPRELRTRALGWGAMAVVSAVGFVLRAPEAGLWGGHLVITIALTGAAIQNATAWLRVSRRQTADA